MVSNKHLNNSKHMKLFHREMDAYNCTSIKKPPPNKHKQVFCHMNHSVMMIQ
jgi:hypothetical protein